MSNLVRGWAAVSRVSAFLSAEQLVKCLSLTFSLPFLGLSLPFTIALSLPFLDLPLPFLDFSLPFITTFSLPFHL